jgi:hypothetical protein
VKSVSLDGHAPKSLDSHPKPTARRFVSLGVFTVLVAVVACSCADGANIVSGGVPAGPGGGGSIALDAGEPGEGATPASGDAGADSAHANGDAAGGSGAHVRVMAANISSGPKTSYDPPESVRLFQGLHPDVVLIQEFKFGKNDDASIKSFVATTFGTEYSYYREKQGGIPNGVISRFPISDSGSWADNKAPDRGFAYAKIDLPGGHPLWAVSLHLLTSNASDRLKEAEALTEQLKTKVPEGDYLVLGGDFNTDARSEGCIGALSTFVVTTGPYPADNKGAEGTNSTRKKSYDWVFGDPAFHALGVPVVIGAQSFPSGLVFDSRVYKPIEDVAPIAEGDSRFENMQHMPVVRDFRLP